MNIILLPRHAPQGRLRVWLGVSDITAAPPLAWKLTCLEPCQAVEPVQPLAVLDLQSVRPVPGLVGAETPRVFSGLYEFSGLRDGVAYEVETTVGDQIAQLRVRTLPRELPSGPEEWFNILLVSCYHWKESRPHALEAAVEEARNACQGYGGHTKEIHLSLLMGDQVYLDLPTVQNFAPDARALAKKFEEDYSRNWFGHPIPGAGYAAVLKSAPTVMLADDHEYWNNYPYASPFIQNSWNARDRSAWTNAAETMLHGFQLHQPGRLGEPVIVDLFPLSICLVDTRSHRDEEYRCSPHPRQIRYPNCLNAGALADLGDWVDSVNRQGAYGMFINGQSLLDAEAGALDRTVGDATLANFKDYNPLLKRLTGLGNAFLYGTGDVHWGRVARLDHRKAEGPAGLEIITSPSSLVSTIGQDEVRKGWGAFKGWMGAEDPWPRHDPAAKVPDYFADKQFTCRSLLSHKGDQIVLLSLQRRGSEGNPSLGGKIQYFPVHPEAGMRSRLRQSISFELKSQSLFTTTP